MNLIVSKMKKRWAAAATLALTTLTLVSCGTEQVNPLPDTSGSDPRVIVHLFEWRWDDVAAECEQFLGPAGYSAVQVSPATESAIVEGRPWYEKYQPASYQIGNRSGDRMAFANMVRRCNGAGVEIISDVVLNHMTGVYSGVGNAGSTFSEYVYPGLYQFDDFHHCGTEGDEIQDWNDPVQVRECELVNLADLKTESASVRTRLALFLKDLASMGVTGIRIDAAKHMWPADIQAILQEAEWSGFVVQEVNDTEYSPTWMPDYYATGLVTDFRYGGHVSSSFRRGEISSLLATQAEEFGYEKVPSGAAFVFVDNHDTQRSSDVLSFKDGALHDLAQVFTLAYPYGRVRVMSSYAFAGHSQGPPMDSGEAVSPVYVDGVVQCSPDAWVCEHRRPAIAGAVAFRAAVSGADFVSVPWTNGSNQIAFGRGNQGFVALNASDKVMAETLKTEMEPGMYCNRLAASGCQTVEVRQDGTISVDLNPLTALAIDVLSHQ
ncbi:alpha-amylase family protein [bacterium]|nr:alpha-amylase family protein [bacterium]